MTSFSFIPDAACPSPSSERATAARDRQASLTKPPGSLGRLEDIAVTLAALQDTDHPRADRVALVVFAGDHGVTSQGVSPYPSSVTRQMLANFAGGGAAISVLCRELGCALEIVDVGVAGDDPAPAGVIVDKAVCGTADFSVGPAMSMAELEHAMAAGARAVHRHPPGTLDLIAFGDMGIGNTTAATAVTAALTGVDAALLAGPGTGLDAAGVARKAAIIGMALAHHGFGNGQPQPDPHSILATVGGHEIAAITGATIAAAQSGIPVVVDGYIASSAVLAACRINPAVRPWLLFAHRSAEPGHNSILAALEAVPLVDLGLRLGEGSGAAIAIPIIRLACALHNGMATFAEAAISQRSKP